MATLSVIVPATDRPATLERSVAAVRRAIRSTDELIVVDGPRGLSASAARNAGARRAAGDVLVFVDADVEVHADALARMRAAFDDPQLTAVFGSYDDAPSVGTVVSTFRNLLHHHVHQTGGGPAETFWAGLGAVRRDQFLATGGFDAERFPHPSIEDIELGARLVATGGRIRLDPAIQGKHLKHWTFRRMVWTDFARRGVPWVGLQLRAGRCSAALNCSWRHRLSALACLVGAASVVLRRPDGVALAVLAMGALNHRFYALMARRRGRRAASVGVGLHALHHLIAVAAVPAGLVVHAYERATAASSRAPAPVVPMPTKAGTPAADEIDPVVSEIAA